MSILGQANPSPTSVWIEMAVLALLGIAAVAIALKVRLFDAKSIDGPQRLGPRESLGTLAIIMFGGFLLWQAIPLLMLQGQRPQTPPLTPATAATTAATTSATAPTTAPSTRPAIDLPPQDLVRITTVASAIAIGAILLATFLLRPGLQFLGLSPRQAGPGMVAGVVAALPSFWIVFVAAIATESIYRALNVTHPPAHDLLILLRQSKEPVVTAILLASALLVAPIYEEILFRGHLQTLFTHGLARLADAPVLDSLERTPPWPMVRWISIIVTSGLFAAMHAPWTMPPIFILSLALGYVYERTGNLWAVITLHALFNITSTILYFLSLSH